MNYEQTKDLLVSATQSLNYAADTRKNFKVAITKRLNSKSVYL
jgi:hypothetical protein